MSLRLLEAAIKTEQSDELHIARLLLLLQTVYSRRRTQKSIEGITKLAKMDFFLRYPTALERALRKLHKNAVDALVTERERSSIESRMVRFRYGPWDARYRRWLGIMLALGLVTLRTEGRTVHVSLTDYGLQVADSIRALPQFEDIAARSNTVVSAVGSMSATRLKNFVYETIPEITDMKWGEEILPAVEERR